MTLAEVYPAVRRLNRADKLRLMQLLVVDVAHEEKVSLLIADAEYPTWTPLNACEAADTLMQLLEQTKRVSVKANQEPYPVAPATPTPNRDPSPLPA